MSVRRNRFKGAALPPARIIRGGGPGRSLRSRVASAVDPVRPVANATAAVISGFFPVIAVVGLMLLLAWSTAMANSP